MQRKLPNFTTLESVLAAVAIFVASPPAAVRANGPDGTLLYEGFICPA